MPSSSHRHSCRRTRLPCSKYAAGMGCGKQVWNTHKLLESWFGKKMCVCVIQGLVLQLRGQDLELGLTAQGSGESRSSR